MDTEKLKMGWLIVAFDLPVGTRQQRKAATDFREFLLADGFQMIQFSVYARSCVSFSRQETHIDRVKKEPVRENGAKEIVSLREGLWDEKPDQRHERQKKNP